MLPKYREVILDKLERTAGMSGLRDAIQCEASLTPEGIHNRYRVLNGAIYGLASHGKFLGAFKPANRRKDLHGLYLAGGAAHPGPGMPMVMMSGWIAADSLDTDAKSGKLLIDDLGQRVLGRSHELPEEWLATIHRMTLHSLNEASDLMLSLSREPTLSMRSSAAELMPVSIAFS